MNPFNLFLATLSKTLNLPLLKPDPSGVCLLLMKEKHVFLLFEPDSELSPQTILISTPLFEFSQENRNEIYLLCLKENRRFEETLSVKPDENKVYMHVRVHPNIASEQLKVLLDNFLTHFKYWKEKSFGLFSIY